MHQLKGHLSLLASTLLTIPAWLAEHWIAIASLIFSGCLAVFGCIHYYKSWQLKDVERQLKLRELHGEDVFNKYEPPKPHQNGQQTD